MAGSEGRKGRGQDADTPADIPARGWWDIIKRTVRQTVEHRLVTEAAGITFYALLAIFPALAALVALYGLVSDPNTISAQLNALSGVIPGGGLEILGEEGRRVTSASSGTLGLGALIGLLTALWSANGSAKAMFDSLNVVYDEREKRSYLRRTLTSLALTVGALVAVIIAMAGVVVAPIVLGFLGLGSLGDVLVQVLRWPILLITMAVLLAAVYRYGPSRATARWRWVSWGAAFATITWLAVSAGFSWYVAHFGSYNRTYGSLGAVVGFMTWIWISSTVVLVGAELDAEIEHQTEKDTTTGHPKPLGERGASKADDVAPT